MKNSYRFSMSNNSILKTNNWFTIKCIIFNQIEMWESFYSLEFCWKTFAKCGNPNSLFRMRNLESGWRNESHSRSLNYAKVSAELIVATDLLQWRERLDDNGVSLGKRSSDVVTRPCRSSFVYSFNHTYGHMTDCKFVVIETTMFAGWTSAMKKLNVSLT